MIGEATSPAVARWLPYEWRAFGAFLRRPVLPERVTGIRARAIGATLQLLLLDILVMAFLVGLIELATKFGFKTPENAIDKVDLTPKMLAAIVAILPMGEEIVFRCWLSGRAGHIVASVVFVIGVAVLLVSGPQAYPLLVLGDVLLVAVVAFGAVFWLRHRLPMPFFSRHFTSFYIAASVLFALAHLTNYSQGAAFILLPLVIPQLIIGLILGYARVTYGLWSDMLLHILHNGLLISLVVVQKGL